MAYDLDDGLSYTYGVEPPDDDNSAPNAAQAITDATPDPLVPLGVWVVRVLDEAGFSIVAKDSRN